MESRCIWPIRMVTHLRKTLGSGEINEPELAWRHQWLSWKMWCQKYPFPVRWRQRMDTFFILGLLRIKAWIWLCLPLLESLFFTLSLTELAAPNPTSTCHPNASAPVLLHPCHQNCDLTLAPGLAGETKPRSHSSFPELPCLGNPGTGHRWVLRLLSES